MTQRIAITGIFLLSLLGCVSNNNTACPGCSAPTFVVTLVDSTGSKLNGFAIELINAQNDTLTIDDTSYTNGYLSPDTTYEIYGGTGKCKLLILNPKYKPMEIDNLSISYGKCGVNPRILKAQPELNSLVKETLPSYKLLLDSTGRGCGN